MSNQWLNNVRNKMEDHTEDVPDGLWDDIRDELFNKEEENTIIVPGNDLKAQNKAGYKNLWYKVGGVAAAIAVFFIGGRELLQRYHEKEASQTAVNSSKKESRNSSDNQIDTIISKEKSKKHIEIVHELNPNIAEKNSVPENSVFSNIIHKDLEEILNLEKSNLFENQFNTSLFKQEEEAANQGNSINNNESINELKEIGGLISREEKIISEKKKLAKNIPKKSWMLSMLTGSASQNSATQFPGYATLNGATMSISDEIWIAGYEDDPLMAILLANQDKEIDARIRYKIPVTFGLSVYRNLGKNKKWGIGTGINYTKLSTELQSGSTSDFIKNDQTVHYVGIPVQINYNVIQKERFTGYVTAGGLAEKAISGNIKTKYIVNDEIKEETTENINKKPVQFSVNSALGVQFKVVDKIGVYAEPGVGYHFKDNSSLNTIYKDKPFNFNVKFGVRILID
ncbi:Outer membrane protein beta-barrel domain-containing protein [Chryseobacterium soldanellicola]|uniref:Outer membrane protein beta-barrel domain-containing protein n=1 Tax=Chryseobacterium soldanellicola TaxID=311333 RepID=A0A1H1AMY8_9FLAO|nr:outer membrane beta-barrel protein [Chryseobacterium soldanellicola]SDQ40990.1 Outer membrane protein beta-barrel domain-containing protein [Chryseobacterium soldanellicola]